MKKLFSFVFVIVLIGLQAKGYTARLKPGIITACGPCCNCPSTQIKFVYAEIVHQTSYGQVTQWASGTYVTEEQRRAVAATRVRTEALDILGKDGWELTASSTRNFDSGFEIFYYLRKKIE